ncbi:MAG: PD40 domain-containing protein, partial [Anaerolineae bacterium]|nr:PD40 domain-containing protein [Anaerolineae bacterium]
VAVYMNPRWSPDGTMLLIDIGYYEGRGLALLPITGGEPLPLPTLATQATWMPDGRLLVWDYGSAYTEPGLYLVDPANLGAYITVLDTTWHILDALPLTSDAIRILRTSSGDAMGPVAAQPFLVSALPEAQPVANGQGGLIEQPRLSPEGRYAAGLRAMSYGDYGPAGRLVIINLTTGERVGVTTPGDVWALQWGGTP